MIVRNGNGHEIAVETQVEKIDGSIVTTVVPLVDPKISPVSAGVPAGSVPGGPAPPAAGDDTQLVRVSGI